MSNQIILMQTKDEKSYREVFGQLKDVAIEKNVRLNPKLALGDFEKASTNALKYHFPNVEIKGCWFHYRQAIMKRASKIGLYALYHQEEYCEFLNRLGALALIPENQVEEALQIIESIKPNDPKCDELLHYFKRTWIKSLN